MNRIALSAIPFALLLSACDDTASEDAKQGGKAEGEVLGGSISDDMLPLEELTSQSPPAKGAEAAAARAAAAEAAEEAGDE